MSTGPTSLCSCGKDAKARGTWGARRVQHYMCKFCARHQCWECQRTESYICNFLTNRHALLADDPRRRNTASAGAQKTLFLLIFWPLADWELHWLGFEMRPGGTEPWRLPPENAIPGTWCIILKVVKARRSMKKWSFCSHMYSNRLKQLMALAKNISSSNNKEMKDGKVPQEKENDHTCRCVNGPRSDGLRYRGDDPKSAAGGARWSRCSFSSFSFFFLSTQLCLIVLLISISMYAHLLL